MYIKSTKKFADLIFGGKILLREFFWKKVLKIHLRCVVSHCFKYDNMLLYKRRTKNALLLFVGVWLPKGA